MKNIYFITHQTTAA